jgi:cephalosporin hydroxylase
LPDSENVRPTMTSKVSIRKMRTKLERVARRLAPAKWFTSTPTPTLAEALGRWSQASSDIGDHLGTMFYEAVAAQPRLIVELGTRGGVSTHALLAAAEVTDAQVLSVDIEDCAGIDLPERFRARWTFRRADDVPFAGKPFEDFCAERGLPPQAEVVLVDTSHEYAHTRAELKAWMPRLAPRGVMMFHDSNMGHGWLRRLDGKAEPGGNGTRGVIQAIEELVGRRYDENTVFADCVGGYAIQHAPWSSGFLIMRRLT